MPLPPNQEDSLWMNDSIHRCTRKPTATTTKKTAAPMLARRIVKMTPGKSGSSAVTSASVMGARVEEVLEAAGAGGGGTETGPDDEGASASVSCNHVGVLRSDMVRNTRGKGLHKKQDKPKTAGNNDY